MGVVWKVWMDFGLLCYCNATLTACESCKGDPTSNHNEGNSSRWFKIKHLIGLYLPCIVFWTLTYYNHECQVECECCRLLLNPKRELFIFKKRFSLNIPLIFYWEYIGRVIFLVYSPVSGRNWRSASWMM